MVNKEDVLNEVRNLEWPIEFKEKLVVGDIQSNVGITTLWTFPDMVYDTLEKEKYALIGNYYDRQNGISPMIRNCLANPNLRYLFILGSDKSGSKEVLLNFFEKGVDENHKILDTEVTIEKEIPIEELNKLREHVKVFDVTNEVTTDMLNDSAKITAVLKQKISDLEPLVPYDLPKTFPKPKLQVDTWSSEEVALSARGKTVGEVWLEMINKINRFGKVTKMKVKDSFHVKELVNFIAVVEDEDPDNPKMYPFFRFNEEEIKPYYDEICTANIPEGTVYTYGSRLRAWVGPDKQRIDQVQDIIDYLKQDIYRASAVAMTWMVEFELTRRLLNKDKNSPCVVLVHARYQDGKLHFTAYIRSNDMFRGWPLNAFGLRKLQQIIAQGLDVEMGCLTTISGSAHIYEDCWEDAKKISEEYLKQTRCKYDHRGYYIIEVKEGEIFVDHYSPESKRLGQYHGKTALELTDTLALHHAASDPYHYMYLGRELQKAEFALKNRLEYVQDRELKNA
ncbi:thymidylate synthase [Candidatus Woesearchaeota archaeon]|nr:thymidylate synthase [Candidatus Woesearchaeota archaeon]